MRRRSETRRLRLKLVQAAEMTSVLGPDLFTFDFSLSTIRKISSRLSIVARALCNSLVHQLTYTTAIPLYIIYIQLERVGGVEHSLGEGKSG